MSLKIGITGGIGSGKSVVAKILRLMDIPVYECDAHARRLMCVNTAIREDLELLLGKEAYLPDGQLNKPFLAHYLFSSEEHASRVNAIVHPKVRADFGAWAEKYKDKKIVALETALLYEASMEKEVDKVWLVTAPLNIRIERAVSRDASTPEKIRARIARQIPQEILEKQADVLITNDDSVPLLPQVFCALHALKTP